MPRRTCPSRSQYQSRLPSRRQEQADQGGHRGSSAASETQANLARSEYSSACSNIGGNKYILPTSTSAEARQIQVFVKDITGTTHTITPRLCDSVANVKALLETHEDESKLIFEGRELQDDHTLLDYNVQDESTLFLLMILR